MGDQRERKARFPGHRRIELSGVIHEPEGRAGPETALLTHCFTCSKDYKALVAIGRQLAADGVRAFRFDFAGSGQSGGRFSETNLTTNIADLLAAASWIESQAWQASALIGHSLGGAAAILAAGRLPRVLAVCAISTPSSTTHLLSLLPALTGEGFRMNGSAEVTIGPRTVRIQRSFVEELTRYSLEEAVRNLGRDFLVIQGTDDQTNPMAEAERLFEYAGQPKSFFAVPGATHLFAEKEHAAVVGRAVSLWLGACGVGSTKRSVEEG